MNDLFQETKASLKALDARKQSLELEAEAIVSELHDRSSGKEPMGIDTPLTDAEGYPRADIDIYRARKLRGRLAVIRTDHKDLMKKMDASLVQLAALKGKNGDDPKEMEARMKPKPKPKFDAVSGKWVVMNWDGTIAGDPSGKERMFKDVSSSSTEAFSIPSSACAISTSATTTRPPTTTSVSSPISPSAPPPGAVPFARVNTVAPQSPAEAAGLRQGDQILVFGNVSTASTSDPMSVVGTLVPQMTGKQISVMVQRSSGALVTLQLTPKPWSGRGLLGCHILPL